MCLFEKGLIGIEKCHGYIDNRAFIFHAQDKEGANTYSVKGDIIFVRRFPSSSGLVDQFRG